MKGEIRAYRQFLHHESVLFDVGANLGEWSLAVSDIVNDARIFMFEPQPACAARLARLVGAGAKLIQSAVGEAEGEFELFTPDPNGTGGNASLHMRRDTYFSKETFSTIKVKVVTIDGVMKSNAIDRVDFMKMDIEGNELAALRGAAGALQKKAIRALSFEFGSGNINSRTFFHDIWDLLTGHDYKIYRILPAGCLYRIDRYSEELEYFRGVSNYVAAV